MPTASLPRRLVCRDPVGAAGRWGVLGCGPLRGSLLRIVANASVSIRVIPGNMQRWSTTDTGDGQVDVACCRINGDGVRFVAYRVVAKFFKLSVGLIKDRDATAAGDKNDVGRSRFRK